MGQEEILKRKISLTHKDIKTAFSRLRFIARVVVSTRKSISKATKDKSVSLPLGILENKISKI